MIFFPRFKFNSVTLVKISESTVNLLVGEIRILKKCIHVTCSLCSTNIWAITVCACCPFQSNNICYIKHYSFNQKKIRLLSSPMRDENSFRFGHPLSSPLLASHLRPSVCCLNNAVNKEPEKRKKRERGRGREREREREREKSEKAQTGSARNN